MRTIPTISKKSKSDHLCHISYFIYLHRSRG